MIKKIRYWLIAKLAGDHSIVINVIVRGDISVLKGRAFVSRSTIGSLYERVNNDYR